MQATDVVEILREEEIYEDQGFAWALVSDAFNGLRYRERTMGEGYPLRVTDTRIQRKEDWEFFPGYSFCLALSIAGSYPDWAKEFGQDYTEQGELFEALTAESAMISLQGWTIHPTGWTRTRTQRLNGVVAEIAQKLGEATGDLLRWTKHTAKEAGLDILFYRPFPDGRVGVPVFLCQCASGEGWERKLKAPDLRVCDLLLSFSSTRS